MSLQAGGVAPGAATATPQHGAHAIIHMQAQWPLHSTGFMQSSNHAITAATSQHGALAIIQSCNHSGRFTAGAHAIIQSCNHSGHFTARDTCNGVGRSCPSLRFTCSLPVGVMRTPPPTLLATLTPPARSPARLMVPCRGTCSATLKRVRCQSESRPAHLAALCLWRRSCTALWLRRAIRVWAHQRTGAAKRRCCNGCNECNGRTSEPEQPNADAVTAVTNVTGAPVNRRSQTP